MTGQKVYQSLPTYDDMADLCDTVTATGAGAFRGKSSLGIDQVKLKAEGSEEDALEQEGVVF